MDVKIPRRRIERTEAERLGRALRRACNEVLREHGMAIEDVSTRPGECFEFRLSAVADRNLALATAVAAELQEQPIGQGFPMELLGRPFRLGARTYILRGLDRDCPDYPIVVEDAEDGARGSLRDTPTLRAVLHATLVEARGRRRVVGVAS